MTMRSMDSAPRDGSTFEAFDGRSWLQVRRFDHGQGSEESFVAVDSNMRIDEWELEGWRSLAALSYGEATELTGHSQRQPIVVVGLGFGDEAKGATVDYLSSLIPDALAVVRWSGGANAAHNVRHGHRHHTFRLFGSGSFLRLPTFLTDRVVLNLQILMAEAVELEAMGVHNPLGLLVLHGDSLVTTPIHMALNRAREILRGNERHGSCGLGLGETVVHGHAERKRLLEGDFVGNFELTGPTAGGAGLLTADMLLRRAGEDTQAKIVAILKHQARYAEPLIREAVEHAPDLAGELWYGSLEAMAEELIEIANSIDVFPAVAFDRELEGLMGHGTVIFEGSQGVLLDEQWGFHPHTTWAQTEPSGIVDWLESRGHRPYVLGLTRSYMTRHGAGPLPSQGTVELDESMLPVDDNSWGRWQGGLRVAPLDIPLLGYSIQVLNQAGIDLNGLALSHLDAFQGESEAVASIPMVRSYNRRVFPSKNWYFARREENGFLTVNSDELLRETMLDKEFELLRYRPSELVSEISFLLRTPVVIEAYGPKREDRRISEGFGGID